MRNNIDTGWISLYRKLQDNWLYPKNRSFTQLEAWIDLLLNANHKDNEVNIGNEILPCKRGQSIRSQDTLSKRWNWSRCKVRGFLNLLTKSSMITLKTTTKTTIITISNYNEYQGRQVANTQQIDKKSSSNQHQLSINNNGNNDKNRKKENNLSQEVKNERENLFDSNPRKQTKSLDSSTKTEITSSDEKLNFQVIKDDRYTSIENRCDELGYTYNNSSIQTLLSKYTMEEILDRLKYIKNHAKWKGTFSLNGVITIWDATSSEIKADIYGDRVDRYAKKIVLNEAKIIRGSQTSPHSDNFSKLPLKDYSQVLSKFADYGLDFINSNDIHELFEDGKITETQLSDSLKELKIMFPEELVNIRQFTSRSVIIFFRRLLGNNN